MAKGSGATRENISQKRIDRNIAWANSYEAEGYTVQRNMHPNGAFFAFIGNTHKEHEKVVGQIFAENGFSFSLDKEGNATIKMPNGARYTLPSLDGKVEGFTHEIMALNGKPSANKVAEAIQHSFKPIKGTPKALQGDIAISFTPKGSVYHREDIEKGVEEYKRRVEAGETKAKPLVYLHVDETTRKVYARSLK